MESLHSYLLIWMDREKVGGDERSGVYEAVVVDFDGTLYRGDTPVEGAEEVLDALERADVDAVFLSNNPTKAVDDYPDRLPGEVLTSAVVASGYLTREHPDDVVYVVGEDALLEDLRSRGVDVVDDPVEADVVLASMDRGFDYDDLRLAMDALAVAGDFYATDPDRVIPVDGGEVPGSGALVAALEAVSGRRPTVLGKPSEAAARAALDALDATPEDVLVVGDRLDTDVALAEEMGADAALVSTGVSDGGDVDDSEFDPDHVLASVADAVGLIDPRDPGA